MTRELIGSINTSAFVGTNSENGANFCGPRRSGGILVIVSRRPLRSRLAPNQLLQRGHTTAFCPTGIPNCLRKTKPETATSIRKLSPRPRMLPMGRSNLDGCRDSLPGPTMWTHRVAVAYCGVQCAWIVKRPCSKQIWYATKSPKLRLSKPEASAKRWENFLRPVPTMVNAEAMLIVISIMPAMVPTPNTSR